MCILKHRDGNIFKQVSRNKIVSRDRQMLNLQLIFLLPVFGGQKLIQSAMKKAIV